MAHYAKIDSNNMVIDIIVAEQEFIDTLEGTWIQTSYNTIEGVHYDPETKLPDGGTQLRYNFARLEGYYDPDGDAFYGPKPFESWVLNKEKYIWVPPTPYPEDQTKTWRWDEEDQAWTAKVEDN